MIVLLNDDLMCATPYATFLRSRRLGRRPPAAGFATVPRCSSAWWLLAGALLARHRLARTLAGARVGAGALPVDRQAAAVPQPLVVADLHLALDVLRDLSAQVSFDLQVLVDVGAQPGDFLFGEVADARVARHAGVVAHLL